MANTLTQLQPLLFSAAKKVQQEPYAVLGSLASDFDDKGVAIGDTVRVPVAPIRAIKTFTPSMQPSAGDDATASNVDVQITANRYVDWNLTSEQLRSLQNGGTNKDWLAQLMNQGMRTLRNAAESDAASAVAAGASFAVGVGGTTPFSSDLSLVAQARKAMLDRGAPMADASIIINTDASLNMLQLGVVQQAQQAGNGMQLATGILADKYGFKIKETAQINPRTGTATGNAYVLNGAGVKGSNSLTLGTGTGTITANDFLKIGTDPIQYGVQTGIAAPGAVTLFNPGLVKGYASALAAAVTTSYTPNLILDRNAAVGVLRPPLLNDNPLYSGKVSITDPSGVTYLLVEIQGDGMVTWRLHLAWGFKVINPEFCGILLG